MEQDPRQFELLAVLGAGCGNTATVTLAKHLPSEDYVAVKRINLETCELDFSLIQYEVHQYNWLNHPNIQPALSSFVHNRELWIISPLMGFGSCKDLQQAHFTDGLPEVSITVILRDVLQALDYIHKRGVIHRSVKASHILVSSLGHVTLSGLRYSYSMMDTGRFARAVHDFPNHYTGSLMWASPELLEQNLAGYGTKSDIYSLGITACELANGVVPFSDIPVTQMLLEKVQGVMPRLLDTTTVEPELANDPECSGAAPFHRTFSPHFHSFVELCLKPDPTQRPTAAALLQHPFLKKAKRRSDMEGLPNMLQPVQPLTDIQLPRDDTLGELADMLEATELGEPVAWDFS